MNNIYKNLLLLVVSLNSILILGQENPNKFLPNITPPSPVAYELGKYGNQSSGLFTGMTNISIPLYTYKTGSLEVPITLNYAKGGIKVDETSGNVGLGWNLCVGGSISRIIRDRKDDSEIVYSSDAALEEGLTPEKYEYYALIGGQNVDSEPDLFSFNFKGNSGQFVFDREGEALMLKDSKIQIKYVHHGQYNGFIATDIDGTQYYFYDAELTKRNSSSGGHQEPNVAVTAWYLSKIIHPTKDEIDFTYVDSNYEYVVSKTQTLSGVYERTTICVGEIPGSLVLSNIFEESLEVFGKRLSGISSASPINGTVTFESDSYDPEISGFDKISAIVVKDESNTIVERLDLNYLVTSNHRMFLEEIVYKDISKKYHFNYNAPGSFPLRLSYSQDLWGYYNGKNNSSLIPSGLTNFGLDNVAYNGADRAIDNNFSPIGTLSKIIYPTGGYSMFVYEQNDYSGQKITPPPITTIPLTLTFDGTSDQTDTATFFSPVTQRVKVFGSIQFDSSSGLGICNENEDGDPDNEEGTGHAYGSLQILNVTDNSPVSFYAYNSQGEKYFLDNLTSLDLHNQSKTVFFDAGENINYIASLTIGLCTLATFNIKYLATAPVTTIENIETGGVRVSNIVDYNHNNTILNQKKIYYADSLGSLTHSSGRINKLNLFTPDIVMQRTNCEIAGAYNELKKWVFTSSTFGSLYDDNGNNVVYESVIESQGGDNFENGGIVHNYKFKRDLPANLIKGMNISSCPSINSGWDHGVEMSNTTYSKNGDSLIKISEKTFEYYLDERISKNVVGFSCRKDFENDFSGPVVHYCEYWELSKVYFMGYNCVADHSHSWSISSGKCFASGHENVPQYRPSACMGRNVGDPVYYSFFLENLSIMSYEVRSNWSYLKKMIEIQYDIAGQNPIENITEYSYDNPVHLQLSSEKKITSKSEEQQIKYFYPSDANVSSEPVIAKLLDKNMIAQPLKTETYLAGNKLSEQKTVFKDFGTTSDTLLLPHMIFSAKFPNSNPTLPDGSTLEKKITFDYYMPNGNLVQYHLENDIPICFIWGYQDTKVVAKIEGIALSAIPNGLITAVKAASDTNNEASLISALNALRNNSALAAAMVTTYTHKPIIGVSTITDPKGTITTYEYDAFGRLHFIKDQDGKILTENNYNFKH
jgi:YD repeat-containing protein